MKKIISFVLLWGLLSPLAAAQICQEFDENMNLISVDCKTGKRLITAQEKARMAQKIRAEEQRKAEAEQKKLEQAIEKRKKELAKKRKQGMSGKRVMIDGKYYYLSEEPTRGGKSGSGGIRGEDWLLSVYGGGGAYTKGGKSIGPTQEELRYSGTVMWNAGISGLYFLNSYVGLGLGLEIDEHLSGGDKGEEDYSLGGGGWGEEKSRLSLEKLMLLGRLNLNPAYSTRVYIPFGLGYTRIEDKMRVEEHYYGTGVDSVFSRKTHTNEFVYFAGLGLEFDLTEKVSLGLEGRYNCFKYKSSDFTYLNGLLKVNVKL